MIRGKFALRKNVYEQIVKISCTVSFLETRMDPISQQSGLIKAIVADEWHILDFPSALRSMCDY